MKFPFQLNNLSFILILLVAGLSACDKKSDVNKSDQPKGRTLNYEKTIAFTSAEGDTISVIDVAVADDPDERNAGLMDVITMPQDKGMIFLFETEGSQSFWMANTPLPLDIIYVNSNMEIVQIHRNTTPYSEQTYPSYKPAIYVVEVNGGYTVNYDINEGDLISFE